MPSVDAYDPVMGEDDFVVNQLEWMDVDPGSVRYVIQSHWRPRPLGGSRALPKNAEITIVGSERELDDSMPTTRRLVSGNQAYDP